MAGDATNGVTLVIDADTARYIAQISRAAKATEGLGRSGEGAFKKVTGEMTRSLVKIVSLKAVVEGLARTFVEASKAAAEMNRNVGKERSSMAVNLATLGQTDLYGGQMAIEKMPGGTSLDQRQQFVESMASQLVDEKTGAMKVKSNQVYELSQAYAKGGDILFGKGGKNLISEAETSGTTEQAVRAVLERRFGISADSKDPIADALGKLPPSERQQMALTWYEREADVAQRDAGADRGVQDRMIDATQKMRRANRPGSYEFQDAVGNIVPGADLAIQAGERAIIGKQLETSNTLLTDIGQTLQRMEQNRAPVLNAGGEGAP